MQNGAQTVFWVRFSSVIAFLLVTLVGCLVWVKPRFPSLTETPVALSTSEQSVRLPGKATPLGTVVEQTPLPVEETVTALSTSADTVTPGVMVPSETPTLTFTPGVGVNTVTPAAPTVPTVVGAPSVTPTRPSGAVPTPVPTSTRQVSAAATNTPSSSTSVPTLTPTASATSNIPTSTSAPYPTSTYSPSTQAAAADNLSGMEASSVHQSPYATLIDESGATWIRRNGVIWSDVEPEEGNRKWEVLASLENELKWAAQYNIKVILIVRNTPAWAQKVSGKACGPIKEEKFLAFAQFMRDLVARYSVSPYNVKYWELWNEPDVAYTLVQDQDSPFGCWGDANDEYYGGGYYADMLKVVYPEIKAADSQAQVLNGGLLLDCDPTPGGGCEKPGDPRDLGRFSAHDSRPPKFIEGVLRNGGGNYLDGISFHAYDYFGNVIPGTTTAEYREGQYVNVYWQSSWITTGPALLAKARYLNNLLTTYGLSNKFLINTENALLCVQEDKCQTTEYLKTKAYYVTESYMLASIESFRSNIWYTLTGWRNSGLVDGSNQKLDAYRAFEYFTRQVPGSIFHGRIFSYPYVWGFRFNKAGKNMGLFWSMDGATHSVQLPVTPDAIHDAMGNSLPNVQTVDITLMPVYIELPAGIDW